jgi:hypothetical protein
VAATSGIAATTGVPAAPATPGVALRIGHNRRTRYRNAEQQGSDGPYKSCARSLHSHHPVIAAAVLRRSPATGLDAWRVRPFKLTYIKTQSRTGALTAIARMRVPDIS